MVKADDSKLAEYKEFTSVMERDIRDFDNEAELRKAWKVFDKSLSAAVGALQAGQGFITTSELRHVLSNIGEKLSPDELDALTKEADPDSSGRVEYEQFIKVSQQLAAGRHAVRLGHSHTGRGGGRGGAGPIDTSPTKEAISGTARPNLPESPPAPAQVYIS
ncbi:hypothetical protein QJQ45_010861 [Haematococcus lacustris]|nr:hypothetical protein QJQ45_010861 [Haematococcus lacustris]